MNFAALKTELAARGFDGLSATRLGYYINDARQQLDNSHLWPYREASVTGTAPLSVSDLGTIEAVTNESAHYPLTPATYQVLLDSFGDIGIAGMPEFFYVAWNNGTPEVATYATNGNTIGVQYWRRTPDLVADGDTPLAPADYHQIIVNLAVQRAYLDSDNIGAAQGLDAWVQARMADMVQSLLGGQQIAGPGNFSAMNGAVDA
jgi:hypothetical protein